MEYLSLTAIYAWAYSQIDIHCLNDRNGTSPYQAYHSHASASLVNHNGIEMQINDQDSFEEAGFHDD